MVNCPNCDAVIDVDEEELDEGDTLTCEECGADLSVTGLSPLELETQEDEDEEEEEEEDEDSNTTRRKTRMRTKKRNPKRSGTSLLGNRPIGTRLIAISVVLLRRAAPHCGRRQEETGARYYAVDKRQRVSRERLCPARRRCNFSGGARLRCARRKTAKAASALRRPRASSFFVFLPARHELRHRGCGQRLPKLAEVRHRGRPGACRSNLPVGSRVEIGCEDMPVRAACIGIVLLKSLACSRTKEEPGHRPRATMEGVVTDAAGQPAAEAVVQLKNTKNFRSVPSSPPADGRYHFAGLGTDVEYQVKAQRNGATTSWKTLSVFNTKKTAGHSSQTE